jgi:hypothetical protein
LSSSGPSPPLDLVGRRPAIRKLRLGKVLHRFSTKPHHPIYFDRSSAGRLNAPDGSYGVLYVANARRGAFAETFLRRPGRTLLPRDLVDRKEYSTLEATRTLHMVRLYGRGLAVLGCTAEVTHGSLPYDLPQAWSHAVHAHPARVDGIAFRSRHDDNEICFAIFERPGNALILKSREPDLDQDWFYRLCNHYGVGIAP